jgi:pimeloyl-ACP methyl ester carboxylesterase
VWNGTIARFAPKYTVYVITLPGFSGRAATNQKPLFTTFKRDFWEMLAARKIQKPVVVGHSLGGTLAIALSAEHPERLSAIVAADGLPVFPMLANATEKARETAADAMAKQIAGSSEAQTLAAQKAYMSSVGTNRPELVDAAADARGAR